MKSFNEMLFERHSIRRYTDEPLDADEVKKILEAALLGSFVEEFASVAVYRCRRQR